MIAKALLRNAPISPRKMRGLLNLIRGENVIKAMTILEYRPQKNGKLLKRLLVSAIANAERKGVSDVDRLVIFECFVNNGPIIKRWMPRSMGRANQINRRMSHVELVVSDKL